VVQVLGSATRVFQQVRPQPQGVLIGVGRRLNPQYTGRDALHAMGERAGILVTLRLLEAVTQATVCYVSIIT